MRLKIPIMAIVLIMLVQVPLADQTRGSPVRQVDPLDDPEMPPIGFFRGILPNNASGEDLGDLYEEESVYNQFVPVWGRPTPFYDMPEDLGGGWGDLFVDDLIRNNGMFPLIHLNFHGAGMNIVSPANITSPTLNNTQWRELYRSSVMEAVSTVKPAYLSIGNEVNRWIPKWGMNGSDNGFENYVSLYNEIYDEVKERSPRTKVFCTFARENQSANQAYNLSLLSKFDPDRLDLLVFTSYPHSVSGINSPDDIPDDYYSQAFDYIEKIPVGFSEIAWPSLGFFGGEQGQVEFINQTTRRLTEGLDLELLGWSWLTDLSPATAIGLRETDGTEKPSYEAWKMNEAPDLIPDSYFIDLEEDFGTYVHDLNNTFTDPDPWDILSYEIWNGTAYANITDITRTSVFQARIDDHSMYLRSLENRSGITDIRLRATDYFGETKTGLMRITVEEINDPPALIRDTLLDPIPEDRYRITDLSLFITDCDDALSELNVTVLDSPYLDVLVNPPGLRFYTTEPDWSGETYILMNARDPEGGELTFNLTVNIFPVNDEPLLLAPKYINMTEDIPQTFDLDIWGYDKEEDNLSWRVLDQLESAIDVEINGTDLTITPAENFHGEAFFDLDVSDDEYNITRRITVNVRAVNDPPTLDPPEMLYMWEDTISYFNLTEMNITDADGDAILFDIIDFDPVFRAVSFPLNDTIRIAPSLDSNGVGSISFMMSDPHGGSTNVTMNVTIRPINDPPFILPPDDWEYVMEPGENVTVDLPALDVDLHDVESNLSDLTLETPCTICSVSGLVLTISLPEDTVADSFTINFEVLDPEGASTGPVPINITVERGPNEGENSINITSYEVTTQSGEVIITAKGSPNQTIYVVFSDGSCTKMNEKPMGSGNYRLAYSSDDWEDGKEVTFHFSATFKGDNDSQWSETGFTYFEEKEGGDDYTIYYILAGTIALIGLALILFAFYRRSRGSVNEFDYDSFME